jgi:hypothetical protein
MQIKVKDWNYSIHEDLTNHLFENDGRFYEMEYDVSDVELKVCLLNAQHIEIKGYQPNVDLQFVVLDYLTDLNDYINEKYGKFVVEI